MQNYSWVVKLMRLTWLNKKSIYLISIFYYTLNKHYN